MAPAPGAGGPAPVGSYQQDRMPHLAALLRGLPDAIAARSWPRERVLRLQEDRLRALLSHARQHSPWHAERLRGVDVGSFRVADLPSLPPMTKAELMEHWDAIVTDRHITRARAETHLARVAARGPAYFDGTRHVVSTSGTTARRAVMLWDFDGWLEQAQASYAVAAKILLDAGGEWYPLKVASVAGGEDATYYTQAVSACFSSDMLHIDDISPGLPIAVVVERLNRLQPTALIGYPSMLEHLARSVEAGALRIAPRWVGLSGEPLYPESRVLLERAFGAPVSESWGSTETGPLSFGALGQPMRLHEPAAVVEAVDASYQACAFGERSASTLVTNLVNKVLPLIRYELGDEIVLEPPEAGDGAGGPVVAEVRGRHTDTFVYEGGTVVHPAAMEQLFGAEPSIVDYQVRQTRSGVHVRLRTSDGHNDDESASRVRRRVEEILATAGLPAADVHLERVDKIDRLASGKVKRFVALPTA